MSAITGVAPQPGTTFPCPELPIDLRRLPIAVFCPMTVLEAQKWFVSGYCMGSEPYEVEFVYRFDAKCFLIVKSFNGL